MKIIKKYGYTLILVGLLMVLSVVFSVKAEKVDIYLQSPMRDLSQVVFGLGLIFAGVEGAFFPEALLKRGFRSRIAYWRDKPTPIWHVRLTGILALLGGALFFLSGAFALLKWLFM